MGWWKAPLALTITASSAVSKMQSSVCLECGQRLRKPIHEDTRGQEDMK